MFLIVRSSAYSYHCKSSHQKSLTKLLERLGKLHLFLCSCSSRSSPSWFNSSWWASSVNRTDLVWILTGLVWIRAGLLLNLFREIEEAQPDIGLAWLDFCRILAGKAINQLQLFFLLFLTRAYIPEDVKDVDAQQD